MIKSIKVTNHLSESITLLMGNPGSTGFSIRGIDGLGPPKGDINTTQVLSVDGSYYNSSRIQERNIVITLGMENVPNETIEELRLKTYKYFPVKRPLDIEIETDTRSAKVKGYVESNSPVIFSKDETTVISIICPNAYFYSLCSTLTEFTSQHGSFEFPFSNESTTEKLIEFSSLIMSNVNTIVYDGDSEAGFYISIKAIGTVTDLSIYNMDTGETMFINTAKLEAFTGDPIIKDDEILISTIKGDKYIYLMRGGVIYNILNCLESTSVWLQMKRGDNTFMYNAVTGLTNIMFEIMHNTLYEGV